MITENYQKMAVHRRKSSVGEDQSCKPSPKYVLWNGLESECVVENQHCPEGEVFYEWVVNIVHVNIEISQSYDVG